MNATNGELVETDPVILATMYKNLNDANNNAHWYNFGKKSKYKTQMNNIEQEFNDKNYTISINSDGEITYKEITYKKNDN